MALYHVFVCSCVCILKTIIWLTICPDSKSKNNQLRNFCYNLLLSDENSFPFTPSWFVSRRSPKCSRLLIDSTCPYLESQGDDECETGWWRDEGMVRQGYEGGRDSEGLLVRPWPQVVRLSQGTSARQSPEMEPCDKPLKTPPIPAIFIY